MCRGGPQTQREPWLSVAWAGLLGSGLCLPQGTVEERVSEQQLRRSRPPAWPPPQESSVLRDGEQLSATAAGLHPRTHRFHSDWTYFPLLSPSAEDTSPGFAKLGNKIFYPHGSSEVIYDVPQVTGRNTEV